MEGLLDAALTRTAESLTPRLRARAQELGWPPSVAQSLTVTHDSTTGRFAPQWPDEANDHVLDYEGGSTSRSPIPALYKFFDSPDGEADIQETLNAHLQDLADDLKRRMFR